MTRILLVLAFTACTGGSSSTPAAANSVSEGNSCTSTNECRDGLACLAYGERDGTCVPECTASADDCGAEASCGGVGALNVEVCQDDDDATPSDEVPAEEDRPRIPCTTDAECAEYGSDAICAEWMGIRDCTIACTTEATCDVPSVGGISVDLMTCIPDEADPSRSGCLPDEACFASPFNCIDGFPGF